MSVSRPAIAIDCPAAAALADDAAWWALYAQAFPPAEREPPEVIVRGLSLGVGVALRARAGGRTTGLATLHLLRNPPMVFLVYLAVATDARGGGLGSALFEQAWAEGAVRMNAGRRSPSGMVWEVEAPLATADLASIERQRRIDFFRRRGGRLLDQAYLQPPIDGVAPVPMRLMYRPADGADARGPDVEALVRAIYFEKYGEVNGIDTHVLRALLNCDPQ